MKVKISSLSKNDEFKSLIKGQRINSKSNITFVKLFNYIIKGQIFYFAFKLLLNKYR